MQKCLIAEIGNCHMGSLSSAREHILAARDAGADLVKMQAFEAHDLFTTGSMPRSFYEACAFTRDEYLDLIYFARERGIELFYSIFSPSLSRISLVQHYDKVAASQLDKVRVEDMDRDTTFVSVNEGAVMPPSGWKHASMMMATHYLNKHPSLEKLLKWEEYTGRSWGLSDHSIGISNCVIAIERYGVRVIEKHFTVAKNQVWAKNFVFRDTVHGATPDELKDLARILERVKDD